MKVSQKGLVEIASHEGIVTSPYKDSVGIWTFGIGHTAGAGAPRPATMPKGVARPIAEIMDLFGVDVAKFETRVNAVFKGKLKQSAFDGAVSFDFNTGKIHSASWVDLFKAGKTASAKISIMKWKIPKEIIPRRKKERDLIFAGRYTSGGFANVYPADARGRVLWGKGKRINVGKLMDLPVVADVPQEPANDAMADGILERGERGPAVEHLIMDLIALDLYTPANASEPDKVFGPRTETAVREFQKMAGLRVDGKAGPQTFTAVNEALANIEAVQPEPAQQTPTALQPTVNPPQAENGGLARILKAIIRALAAIFERKDK